MCQSNKFEHISVPRVNGLVSACHERIWVFSRESAEGEHGTISRLGLVSAGKRTRNEGLYGYIKVKIDLTLVAFFR